MVKATSSIPYPAILGDALRTVPRTVLRRVEAEGLPGPHHFYISFRMGADSVVAPASLRAQYPDTMTIVLQHDFRELRVEEEGFGVNLAFGGVRTDLYIPFSAITLFVDPSVELALDLSVHGDAAAPTSDESAETSPEQAAEPTEDRPGDNVVSVDFGRRR